MNAHHEESPTGRPPHIAIVGSRAEWFGVLAEVEVALSGFRCEVVEGIEELDASPDRPALVLVARDRLGVSLRRIARKEWARHTPVLAMLEGAGLAERAEALAAGAWDVLEEGLTSTGSLARLGALIRLTERAWALARQRDALFEFATTDPLTRLPNRRHLFDQLERELARARRNDEPMAVALFDIDHFKDVNDVHGHAAGDAVLIELARTASGLVRETDVLARLGGEEFVLGMPQTSLEHARAVCERLRSAISRMRVACGGASIRVTVSVGVAVYRPPTDDVHALLDRADRAMFGAKEDGRNRVLYNAR